MVSNNLQTKQKQLNKLKRISNEMKNVKYAYDKLIRKLIIIQIDKIKKRNKLYTEAGQVLYSINRNVTTINQVKNNEIKLKKYKNIRKKANLLHSDIIEIRKDLDEAYTKMKSTEKSINRMEKQTYNIPINNFISRYHRRNGNENRR